jgi:hypothetical protein
MEEHQLLVTKVFFILEIEELLVVAQKSFFHIKEVDFFGYIINLNGVEMSTRKVEVMHS